MKKQNAAPLRRIFSLVRRYRLPMALSLFFALISSALMLYVPIEIGRAIDEMIGIGQVNFTNLANILIRIAVFAAASGLLSWLVNVMNNRITAHVVRDMRTRAFAHLEHLPLSYLDAHPKGDTVSRLVTDVDQFSDGLLLGFTQLFTGLLTIVGTLVFMLLLDWRVALMVVILTPISLFVAKFISSRTYRMFKLQNETRGEQTAHINERIGNMKVVAALSAEDETLAEYDEISGRLSSASLRAIFFSSLTNPTTRFVNNLIYAAVTLVGALACLGPLGGGALVLTVGELTTLLTYVNQYTKPFNEISGIIAEFQNSLACGARYFAFLDEPTETPDPENAAAPEMRGNVTFSDVSFSYTPEKPLIEHLSLDVPAGRHVAIVGPTGCGKTTLINLLMRFFDPQGGALRVEGTDIRDMARHTLRGGFGMVLQETWLSSGTVKENIAMGKPDATDDEIRAAAIAAHAHGFITRLEKGYDTPIGEGGGNLSEGERQLLCIARVMLALPPVLILDEATSSIDTRTEMKIQSAFATMMEGRTSFIVAHRLSTIKEADVILVMRDGHIVEQGSHSELLAKGGFYATLYNSQFAK